MEFQKPSGYKNVNHSSTTKYSTLIPNVTNGYNECHCEKLELRCAFCKNDFKTNFNGNCVLHKTSSTIVCPVCNR